MAFGSGSGQEIDIKVVVDASGSMSVLNSLGQEVAKLEGAVKKSDDGFKGWQKTLIAWNQGLELTKKALGGVKAAFEQIKLGANIADIAESFELLSRSAGASSDVLINKLQTAVGGTVDKLTLMRGAIEGMRAGMKPQEVETMAAAARYLAEATGKDLP